MADDKKVKVQMPVFAGLAIGSRVLIQPITRPEDKAEWKDSGGDLLDELTLLMKRPGVKQRMMDEFTAESIVKNAKAPNVGIITAKPIARKGRGRPKKGVVESMELEEDNTDVFEKVVVFNKVHVTYASWTLSSTIKDYVEARLKKTEVHLFDVEAMSSNARKSDYLLNRAMSVYIAQTGEKKYTETVELFRKMYELAQSYQHAMYGWNEKDKKFTVDLSSEIYRAHKSFDASFTLTFVDFVTETSVYKEWTHERPDEIITGIKKAIEWGPVMALKLDRIKKKGTESTLKILRPEQVSEVDFRGMVKGMCDVVFKDVERWDEIEVDPKNTEQLSTALCLLMLGIGSRARGIIMVNQIEALDYDVMRSVETKEQEEVEDESIGDMRRQLMARTVGYGTLRVKRLTKEKRVGKMVEDKIKMSEDFSDEKLTTAEAKELVAVDRSVHMIDKPFLYMLFSRYEMAKEQKGMSDEEVARQRPRDVFIQLFKTVRDAIKQLADTGSAEGKYDVKWESYTTLGKNIWMIKEAQDDSKGVDKFMKQIWVDMNKTCVHWLSSIPNLKEKNPHQLRRMYVCYSYEYFGRGISKEIGYAQYVLRHTNIATSMLYTTMSFKMALSDSMADDSKFKDEFVKSVVDVRVMLDEIKELRGMLGTPHKRKMVVDFVDISGDPVNGFKKMKRAPNGKDRDWLINRAMEQVKLMYEKDIPLTRVNLTKAGINTDIVLDVMARIEMEEPGWY